MTSTHGLADKLRTGVDNLSDCFLEGVKAFNEHPMDSALYAVKASFNDYFNDYFDVALSAVGGYLATRYNSPEAFIASFIGVAGAGWLDSGKAGMLRTSRNFYASLGGVLIGTGNTLNVDFGVVSSAVSLGLNFGMSRTIRNLRSS